MNILIKLIVSASLIFIVDNAHAGECIKTGLAGVCIEREPDVEATGDVDEFGIIEATMKCTDCIDYSIVGECNWVSYYIFSVEWDVSVVARHYLPDYVVAVYNSVSPYDQKIFDTEEFFKNLGEKATGLDSNNSDIRTLKEGSISAAAGGMQPNIDTNLDYKKVDIFVNPGIIIWNEMAESLGWSCASNEETPGIPKFISDVDPAWRGFLSGKGAFEEIGQLEWLYPQSIIGFPRQSRSSFDAPFNAIKNFEPKKLLESFKNIMKAADLSSIEFWGPIFPRNGWSSLPHDSMSALVAASRAADILTNNSLPHVVMPVGDGCDFKCWPPDGVELDNDENKFQLVYPYVEDSAAPLPRTASWAKYGNEIQGLDKGNLSAQDHAWAWVLWRQYECCKKEGMFFLGAIKW